MELCSFNSKLATYFAVILFQPSLKTSAHAAVIKLCLRLKVLAPIMKVILLHFQWKWRLLNTFRSVLPKFICGNDRKDKPALKIKNQFDTVYSTLKMAQSSGARQEKRFCLQSRKIWSFLETPITYEKLMHLDLSKSLTEMKWSVDVFKFR